jgi:protein phosphatase
MKILIPDLSLVLMIGASGCGKSTFARRHFKPTEILSSDYCRGLVSDDENDQTVSKDAFEVLHFIAAKRLRAGRLTVIDATNVQQEARKPLIALAREYHVLPVGIILNPPMRLCIERNRERPDRNFGPQVIQKQARDLRGSIKHLDKEGLRRVFELSTEEEIETAVIEREPLWNNRKHEHGPFDIIGDVHGCCDELEELLAKLGYRVTPDLEVTPPEGRKAVFVGDLVDRGPRIPDVLRIVMGMTAAGTALCVPGNHDVKLLRKLRGRDVPMTHGLTDTWEQLSKETPEFRDRVAAFLDKLISHYVLDGGKLVVAHAGLKEEMQGRGSAAVREFALFGETTGETDEFGLPVRGNWAAQYRGTAMVVYGHTPVAEPEWLNHTINIDTGCVFGGKLTALRYPERELVSVPARKTYYQSLRPFLAEPREGGLTAQQRQDDLLELEDVTGKRAVTTRLLRSVTIREENAAAALEAMSRFAANPKWLIYLPPTMSPCETSEREGYLEYPSEAFAYFRHEGAPSVICQQKHMGSRAVVILCRDEAAVRKSFGITGEGIGIVYTRTGRRFFTDGDLEQRMLARLHSAATSSGLWEQLQTQWLCLDCELMPWSAKAQELIRQQYQPAGEAALATLPLVIEKLEAASGTQPETAVLAAEYRERLDLAQRYVAAYRRYCWPVESLDDMKLAPFHLLASEGSVHVDKDHLWHMRMLEKFCAADPGILLETPFRTVDLSDPASERAATEWWEQMTESGGEGMVVKPPAFVFEGRKGLAQPAMKCRGREYLRIIYGPEYTREKHLTRLRHRGVAAKGSLAVREFALGIEALERFVQGEPLRRVHECVFGVLALESEPVDPRL